MISIRKDGGLPSYVFNIRWVSCIWAEWDDNLWPRRTWHTASQFTAFESVFESIWPLQEIAKIESGEWTAEENPLKNAPHTQLEVCASEWKHPYSREEAAFPAPWLLQRGKFWPTVARVDNSLGDRKLKLRLEEWARNIRSTWVVSWLCTLQHVSRKHKCAWLVHADLRFAWAPKAFNISQPFMTYYGTWFFSEGIRAFRRVHAIFPLLCLDHRRSQTAEIVDLWSHSWSRCPWKGRVAIIQRFFTVLQILSLHNYLCVAMHTEITAELRDRW